MENKGIVEKYIISRTDGSPIDPENKYFVLKLEGKGDIHHMAACRVAILAYAQAVRYDLPELSEDIIRRYGNK